MRKLPDTPDTPPPPLSSSLAWMPVVLLHFAQATLLLGLAVEAIGRYALAGLAAPPLALACLLLPVLPTRRGGAVKCAGGLVGAIFGWGLYAGAALQWASGTFTSGFSLWPAGEQRMPLLLAAHLPATGTILGILWAWRAWVPRGRVQFSFRQYLLALFLIGVMAGWITPQYGEARRRWVRVQIHQAARDGDIAGIERCAAINPESVMARDAHGRLALHEAGPLYSRAVVERLLALGSPIDGRDDEGRTPLHLSIRRGRFAVVDALLAHGADPNLRDANGHAPLIVAMTSAWSAADRIALADTLIRHGADPTGRTPMGETALHFAAMLNEPALVAFLLRTGAEANTPTRSGHTPLFATLLTTGDIKTAQVLLQAGADVNARDANGMTVLHYAAALGVEPVAVWLLANGGDPNARNLAEQTPLHHAADRGREAIVALLLQHGAAPGPRDLHGITPVHLAALRADGESICTRLQEAGAPVGLHAAAALGDPDRLARLLETTPQHCNAPDAAGWTPLHWAARAGRVNTVRWLLERTAAPNAVGRRGATPLLLACQTGHENTAVLLLEHHADPNRARHDGLTPLHCAVEHARRTLVRALLQAGADPNPTRDEDGATPLHLAMDHCPLGLVLQLLEAGARVNKVDQQGRTPLHLAASQPGYARVLRRLLKAGAMRGLRDKKGKTARDYAEATGDEAMVRLLGIP